MNKLFLARKISFLIIIISAVFKVFGGNPIITHIFTADPAALVHGDSVYLYTGHDEASPTATFYNMNDWHVFSSGDMVTWTDHGEVLKLSDFSWAAGNAWAGHCVERNGKFYWYVPVSPKEGGGFAIGVAVGSSPTGPFTDAVGAPIITDNMTDLANDIDPAVFIDDDGQAYLYWGNGGCRVVKLKENMIELDGTIINLSLPNFTEASYLHKRDSIYYFSYAGYWPETIEYATGTSPLGPFMRRSRLNALVSSTTNHQSIIEFKNQWYFIYHNGDLPGGGDYRRSVAIDYLFYNPDGTLMEIVQTKAGVAHADSTSLCPPVPLTAKAKINNGNWTTNREPMLIEGDSIKLSPEASVNGSWVWEGPGDFKDSIREISLSNLSAGQSGTYMATFINSCGTKSYMGFNLNINPKVPENIVSGEKYVIMPRNSELAVTVQNASTADGANIIQSAFTNASNQQWRLTNVESVYWRISPMHASGKGLDVNNFSQDDGAKVQTWNYWGGTTQQWQIIEQEPGIYQFKARHSGKCLDVNGTPTTEGARIQQWTCNNTEKQQFLVEVVQTGTSIASVNDNPEIINVYPNPGTSGEIVIELASVEKLLELIIVDINGKIIYRNSKPENNIVKLEVDIGPGIYFAKVKGSKTNGIKKIIINKQ